MFVQSVDLRLQISAPSIDKCTNISVDTNVVASRSCDYRYTVCAKLWLLHTEDTNGPTLTTLFPIIQYAQKLSAVWEESQTYYKSNFSRTLRTLLKLNIGNVVYINPPNATYISTDRRTYK